MYNKLNSKANHALSYLDNFLFFFSGHTWCSHLRFKYCPEKKYLSKTTASQFIYRLCLLAIFLLSGCELLPTSTIYPAMAAAICALPSFCHPAVLKHHRLSSVFMRYRPASRAFISCTAELPLSERPCELLAYADCVFVLPAALSWAQTAPAG